VHVDADAFFASCEQAANPKLRGKPVVTGKERGIASAVSYEAVMFQKWPLGSMSAMIRLSSQAGDHGAHSGAVPSVSQ
jgi:nucleotidyltransferase/DNA polymerase involved in DNA repair